MNRVDRWIHNIRTAILGTQFGGTTLVHRQWVKIGTHGFSRVIRFHPDGSFIEADAFGDGTETWTGSWHFAEDGALIMEGPGFSSFFVPYKGKWGAYPGQEGEVHLRLRAL